MTCHTTARDYTFYGKLDAVAAELGEAFVRIHQRYGGTLEAGVRDGRFRLMASIPLPGGPDRP